MSLNKKTPSESVMGQLSSGVSRFGRLA